MGAGNKLQPYPYTLKTVAAINQSSCGYRFFMYMLPPKDALTIERLFCHFVMTFDSGIPAASRVLKSIGIVDELRPFPATADANYQRRQTLNLAADANRKVDVALDLTHLLKHDNVQYSESGFDDNPIETGYTAVEIMLPDTIDFVTSPGTIDLWKIDGLFTTIGIR